MDPRELGVDAGEVNEIARQNPHHWPPNSERGEKSPKRCNGSTKLSRKNNAEHPAAADAPAAAAVDNFETRTRRFFDMINDGDIQQLRVLIDSLDADELNILLRRTLDPVERGTRSRSALWSAIYRRRFAIVDLLVVINFRWRRAQIRMNRSLAWCTPEHRVGVVDGILGSISTNTEFPTRILVRDSELVETDADKTPLFAAVDDANLALCHVLVARGANIDLGTDFGITPLMLACSESQTETATFLVENGANIDLQNGDGATALMAACYRGNVDIVRLLLSHGANVEHMDFDGHFPLVDAVIGGHLEVCRLLVEEWAADVNQQTIQDRAQDRATALTCAASRGHLAIVIFLIEHDADLQHVEVDGHNALMWAVKRWKTEVARHLVAIGADINQRNTAGKSAQDLAEERGNAEMMAIFRTPATDNGQHAEGTDGQQNDQQQQQM
ncbi:hypothetical protein niasHT_025428 [Heterodera trifolii]|uniref:Uncharacterized protein n=1 Tax=Heterodera trifolii TaxID=157864 RepID=A0ABD2JWW1_9BILA